MSLSLASTACGPVASDAPPLPAATADAGGGADASSDSHAETAAQVEWDASACGPGDVQTFVPGGYVPAHAPQDACDPDDIEGIYESCLGPNRSPDGCAAVQASKAACFSCLVTPSGGTSYGSVIEYTGFVEPNVAGCVELVSQGGMSCAKSLQALAGCQLQACEANCPVTDASSLAAFEGCSAQAEAGGCEAYAQAASCFWSQADAGPLSVCSATDFHAFFVNASALFCSAGDAGSASYPVDAASD